MTRLFSYIRLHLACLVDQSRFCILASRLCLAFTAILLAVSPWTEYHCDWDRFLQGGPDLEFSLLAAALALCLVLLLSQRGSQVLVAYLASLRRLLSHPPLPLLISSPVGTQREGSITPGSTSYTLPLQI